MALLTSGEVREKWCRGHLGSWPVCGGFWWMRGSGRAARTGRIKINERVIFSRKTVGCGNVLFVELLIQIKSRKVTPWLLKVLLI